MKRSLLRGSLRTQQPRIACNRKRFSRRLRFDQLEDRRLLTSGAPDPTFGIDGIVQTGFENPAPSFDYATHATLETVNGVEKPVVLAFANGDPYDQRLVRYNADGSIDSSFGGAQGLQFHQILPVFDVVRVAAQGDQLVLLGVENNPRFLGRDLLLARLNSDGTLDTAFGNQGVLDTGVLTNSDRFAYGPGELAVAVDFIQLAVQGSDLVVATSTPGEIFTAVTDVTVARFTATGLDRTFGDNGRVVYSLSPFGNHVTGLRVEGAYIAVSSSDAPNSQGTTLEYLTRFTSRGIDAQFGANGTISIPAGATWTLQGEKTLVASRIDEPSDMFEMRMYDAAGNLDSSFGTQGVATATSSDGSGFSATVAFDPFGGIYANGDLTAYRVLQSGRLDTAFGDGGAAPFFDPSLGDYSLSDFLVESDGKIVLVGGRDGDILLTRLLGSDDNDGDGIANGVDPTPTLYSNTFSDGTTSAQIVSRGDQILTISDAPNPAQGVVISAAASGGATPATISIDGGAATLTLSPGDRVTVTHGSVIVSVLAGTVEATYRAAGGQVVATAGLPAGTELTFKPDTVTFIATATPTTEPVAVTLIGAGGQQATANLPDDSQLTFNAQSFTFIAPATNSAPVEVVVNGAPVTVAPGATVKPVQIDVKPGESINTLNLDSNGVLAVAILSSATFDARSVAVNSVTFAGAHAVQSALQDVNRDGRLDLVLNFKTQQTNLRALYSQLLADDINGDGVLDSSHQTASVALSGETVDHVLIEGFDNLDLFLAGKALRTLLDQLAASGAI